MRFIDIFAGLGGFHQALASLGGECVFASEIDDKLRAVYENNFDMPCHGDITKIDPKLIPDHELLCAGFPCQPFSKAGGQEGLQDKIRGTVFFNIVEILRIKKPKYVMLENVAHFVAHDEGRTYETVCEALKSLGYDISNITFSPHQFGIPQIRERMYLVGCASGLDGFTWPEPKDADHNLSIHSVLGALPEDIKRLPPKAKHVIALWQEFMDIIPEDEWFPSPLWAMEFGCTYPYLQPLEEFSTEELQTYRGAFGVSLHGKSRSEIFASLPPYARLVNKEFPVWKRNFITNNRAFYLRNSHLLRDWLPKIACLEPSHQKFEWNCRGEPKDLSTCVLQFRASGLRVKRATTAPSLVAMTTTQIPVIPWEDRYMTVRECAKLQSMDDLKFLPEATTNAIKALGNAVNVTVVKSILEEVLRHNETMHSANSTCATFSSAVPKFSENFGVCSI